tara:strand:+ start:4173 stop:4460 length:288 start_codon:yes stop_codon:yes gene_type:complete
MAKVTIERKRQILDSAKGQFFSVEFVKKDGSIREMTVKKQMEKAFTYGSANAKPNTVAHIDKYYTAVDAEQEQFRNINLETLRKAKVAGITYIFD